MYFCCDWFSLETLCKVILICRKCPYPCTHFTRTCLAFKLVLWEKRVFLSGNSFPFGFHFAFVVVHHLLFHSLTTPLTRLSWLQRSLSSLASFLHPVFTSCLFGVFEQKASHPMTSPNKTVWKEKQSRVYKMVPFTISILSATTLQFSMKTSNDKCWK